MKKPKTPPLPIGTPVEINIGQGGALAQGVITAAEYDDGWLYRVDVTGGDECRQHRNGAGELWVCEFEVQVTQHDENVFDDAEALRRGSDVLSNP